VKITFLKYKPHSWNVKLTGFINIYILLHLFTNFYFKGNGEDHIAANLESGNAILLIVKAPSGNKFHIVIEKCVIFSEISSFAEGIMYLMVYHYIFNLQYSAPNCMEFIQRAVLKIGITDKKASRKVATLLNSLKID